MSAIARSQDAQGFVFQPALRARGLRAYSTGDVPAWVDLRLDANEGPAPGENLPELLRSLDPESLRRYPDARSLERALAGRLAIDPARVVVTAGGDDAIDRLCRLALEPGREALLHTPTFEMIHRGAILTGASPVLCPWTTGPFPTESFIRLIGPGMGLVSLVSPNNPTGAVIPASDIVRICEAAASVGALVLVDLAYVEFADSDPTPLLTGLKNAVLVRTFSKALGLAGLRVGYAVAPAEIAPMLRAMGGPYPTSGLSLALAARSLTDEDRLARVRSQIRSERSRLTDLCTRLDLDPLPSEGNFVLVRTPLAALLRERFMALGISVRAFASKPALENALRITLPGSETSFERLDRSIRSALAPEALLLDMDGVLADVSRSYREAIVHTAAAFGITLTADDVRDAKALGNANNDWVLTQRLLEQRGLKLDLATVVKQFQRLYLGTEQSPGLRSRESLIPSRALLESLASRTTLALVTGRPRAEAEWFLDREGIRHLFAALVCMEDAPAKPSPAPVLLAMDRLSVRSAWLVGDTIDDVRAARRAGVLPIGIAPPGDPGALETLSDGGAITIATLTELERILP